MCKATVVFEEKLGKRREGWCVFLEKSRDFTFYSDKQIKNKIFNGELVNGLKVGESGEVVMDEEFTTSLLSKSGLSTFTPIKENEDGNIANKYYAVVTFDKDSNSYELVTNRNGLEVVDESRLRAMLSLIEIGGARLDNKGRVVLHRGVTIKGVPGGSGGATEG